MARLVLMTANQSDGGVPEFQPQIRDVDYGNGVKPPSMAFVGWERYRGLRDRYHTGHAVDVHGRRKKRTGTVLPPIKGSRRFVRERERVALTGIRQKSRQIADFPAARAPTEGLNVAVRRHVQGRLGDRGPPGRPMFASAWFAKT